MEFRSKGESQSRVALSGLATTFLTAFGGELLVESFELVPERRQDCRRHEPLVRSTLAIWPAQAGAVRRSVFHVPLDAGRKACSTLMALATLDQLRVVLLHAAISV